MKILAAIIPVLFLSGCDEGQETALNQCELNALSTYKDGYQTWGPDSVGYRNYINTCMKVAGFAPDIRPNRCVVGFFTEHSPYCYSPSNHVAYFFWIIKTEFEGGLVGKEY
jgi:hypothetical protein